jgi:hypothetical protein
VEWLIRTASLPSRGMPPGSFTVDLNMRAKEAARLWRFIERAARTRSRLPEEIRTIADVDPPDFVPCLICSQVYGAYQHSCRPWSRTL